MFKLGRPIWPFDVNSKQAFKTFEALLKKMNFDLGDIWHYDPHGFISQRREKIKHSTYEHEYRPKIEWKANLDSWPMNREMEIEAPVTKDKAQKRTMDQTADIEMEDVHVGKNEKTQETK